MLGNPFLGLVAARLLIRGHICGIKLPSILALTLVDDYHFLVHMKKTLGSGWECYRAHMLPIGSPLGALDLRFALGLPMGGCTGVVIMHYVAIVHDVMCALCVHRERSP